MLQRGNRPALATEPDTDELIDQDLEDILNEAEALEVEESMQQRKGKESRKREDWDVQRLEEDHRAQLLHVETLTMMAKYQIVFIKMEGFLRKIGLLFKRKRRSSLIDGFYMILRSRLSKARKLAALKPCFLIKHEEVFLRLDDKLATQNKAWGFQSLINRLEMEKSLESLTLKEAKLGQALKRVDKKKDELQETTKTRKSRRKSESRSKTDLLKGPSDFSKKLAKAKLEGSEKDLEERYSKLKANNLMIKKSVSSLQQEVMVFLLDINSALDKLGSEKK